MGYSSAEIPFGFRDNTLPKLSISDSSSSNVTSVTSSTNCITVNPTTGDVILTFNTSCASAGAVSSVSSGSDYIIVNPTTGDVIVSFDESLNNETILDIASRFNDTALIFSVNSSLWNYITTNENSWLSTFNVTYNNILNQECPTGNYTYAIQSNGSILCRDDLSGSSGTDNTNIAYLNNSQTFTGVNTFSDENTYLGNAGLTQVVLNFIDGDGTGVISWTGSANAFVTLSDFYARNIIGITDVNASNFHGSLNWSWLQNVPSFALASDIWGAIAGNKTTDTQKNTSGIYLYNDSSTIFFNETQLNDTIDDRVPASSGTFNLTYDATSQDVSANRSDWFNHTNLLTQLDDVNSTMNPNVNEILWYDGSRWENFPQATGFFDYYLTDRSLGGLTWSVISTPTASTLNQVLISGASTLHQNIIVTLGDYLVFSGISKFNISAQDNNTLTIAGEEVEFTNNVTIDGTLKNNNDCGIAYGIIESERVTVNSNQQLAWGNGDILRGIGQACSGTITAISGTCENCATGVTEISMNATIDGTPVQCDTGKIGSIFGANSSSCDVTFNKNSIVGCATNVETGLVSGITCGVYLRYD